MFVCLAEDFGSIELSKKGWNYVGLFLVVLSAIYWLGLCDNGAFFQLSGLGLYISAAILWLKNSAWGEWIRNEMFDNNCVEFED